MAVSEKAFELTADAEAAMRQCVHCGLCLSSCPTYRELGTEMDSPRGRIYLVRALQEERLEPAADTGLDLDAMNHLDLCLGCRACETACPSGVEYGAVIEGARAAAYESQLKRRSRFSRFVQNTLLRRILPSRRWLAFSSAMLNFYHKSGMRPLIDGLLPASLKAQSAKAPVALGKPFHSTADEVYPAKGEKRGRVCFFTGCVMDILMGDIHRDTIKVLTAQGIEVVVPKAQACCGALQVHEGDREMAVELARHNLIVLAEEEFDAFVNNSAGCGAHIQDWAKLMSDDPEFAEIAKDISSRTMDVTRYLVDKGLLPFPNPIFGAAAYDAPCHLYHGQRETEAPLELLRAIRKLRVIELPGSDQCCGAAGSYTLVQPEMSERIFEGKLKAVREAEPNIIVTGNPGCIMQFQYGLAQAGLEIEVKHPMQLAADACEI